MKRLINSKKLLLGLLCVIFVLAVIGCSSKDDSEPVFVTRGSFIGMLGQEFGYQNSEATSPIFSDVDSSNKNYNEIQAAAEWEIIDKGSEFKPDDAATLGFAIESAVKAIGVNNIKNSGASINESDLTGFYVNNIAQIDVSNIDSEVDDEVAKQILSFAKGYFYNLTMPQVTQLDLAEGVKTADTGIVLNADGKTGMLLAEGQYNVGDIVYFDATATSLARCIKITEIDGKAFSFKDADPESVYANLNVRGSFDLQAVEVISASDSSQAGLGREIYDQMKGYQMSSSDSYLLVPVSNSATFDKGSDHITFNAKFDVSNSSDGKTAASDGRLTIGIKNIKADVVYEHPWLRVLHPNEIRFTLHFDTEVSSEIHGMVGATIPLGEAYFNVWGPLTLKVMLTAHVGADGNISVSYTTSNAFTVGWKRGTGLQKDFSSSAQANVHIDAHLIAEATLLADLRVGFKSVSASVANAQISGGIEAKATVDADLMGGQPTCTDIKVWVPLKWGVNQQGCLVTDFCGNAKASGTIWDASNSPIQLHYHIEDGQFVEECTRKEPVEQEIVDPEGEPIQETNPFDFEPLEFDFIELDKYSMYLEKDASMDIGFVSIPGGASKNDLVYEVEDPSVCSVSNGTVHAVDSGSTIVKISTKDGLYSVWLAVTVSYDYSVPDFEEL